MQQHVALAQPVEHRLLARQRGRPRRLEGRKAQRRRAHCVVGLVDQLVQPHQVHRPIHAVERGGRQIELQQQKVRQLGWTGVYHLDAQRLAEVPRRQARAQRLAQIGDVVFIHFQVGVARDAELRKRLDLAAREQLGQMGADHAGQKHKGLAAAGNVRRQLDDPRQHARHLDDGDAVLAPERVLAAQPNDKVQRLVGHLRERVRRIQPHRHQQRTHLGREKLADPAALRLVAVGVVQDHDAFALQPGHQLVVEDRILLVDQRVRVGRHRRQVAHRHAGARPARGLDVVSKAHFEKFVHVGRHDAHITQPLQQRHVGAPRLRQHAPVELQDRALAVQQRWHGQRAREGRIVHQTSL